MIPLEEIWQSVERRAHDTAAAHGAWPCRKGCDDCCRHLATVPVITREEGEPIAAAIAALPEPAAALVRRRIQDSAAATRPVKCPLLDSDSGTCLVYDARPVACRAYGFYADRGVVLGCARIESIAAESPDVIWGNHAALEQRLTSLGEAKTLSDWLDSQSPSS